MRAGELSGRPRVPILALTASSPDEVRSACEAAGIDGILSKPWNPRELAQKLADVQRRAEANPAQVDRDSLLRRVSGNLDMLRTLFGLFRGESTQLEADMAAALQERDATRLQFAAHSFKGMLEFFRDDEGVRTARALERLGSKNRWDGAQELFERLKTALRRVEGSVEGQLGVEA